MSTVTVMVNLSAESAAFMRKCIGNAGGPERDAFFDAAIGALAQSLLDLAERVPSDEDAPRH